jgi:Protein of unknown function (DUF559)
MSEIFIGSEALSRGKLTGYQLRTRYRAVFPDVYMRQFTQPSLADRSIAAWLWSRKRAVVAGLAAATLHGSRWVDDREPVELIWRNTHPPTGVITRNERIDDDEITRVRGVLVTTTARTAFDIGRRVAAVAAVGQLDALMWATPFSVEDVLMLAKRYRGARGLRRLTESLPLVDGGAASPRETWLRLLLIDAGLPPPATQIPVVDGRRLVGVLDMGWEDFKVAAEYDGDQHRTDRKQYVRDMRRLRELERLGWIVIRVIAEDRDADIIDRVRKALIRRGFRDT